MTSPLSEKEKQQRILVVDDNQAMRKMIESMLTTLGYFNIVSAVNGELAWQMIVDDEEGIDIVVSDLIMPKLDGLGFLCRLRESKQYYNIPFIMVTGADQKGDFINTVQSEVDFYLIKPVTPLVLEDALHQVYLQQHSSSPYLKAVHSGKHNIIHGNYEEALEHFSLAQSLEPFYAKPYYFLGTISRHLGNDMEAVTYFKKCLTIEDNYINAIVELAEIYTKRSDFKNMRYYLEKAIEVSPGNFQLFVNMGRAYFNLNNISEAKIYLQKAGKLAKSNKDNVRVVVDALIEATLLEEADYLYGNRLQDDDDDTVKFWNKLGLKAKSIGQVDRAKQFYMAALKIRPQNKVINFNMSLLLVEQKEYEGAFAYISKSLRLHPNFKAGHELKDAIKEIMGRQELES